MQQNLLLTWCQRTVSRQIIVISASPGLGIAWIVPMVAVNNTVVRRVPSAGAVMLQWWCGGYVSNLSKRPWSFSNDVEKVFLSLTGLFAQISLIVNFNVEDFPYIYNPLLWTSPNQMTLNIFKIIMLCVIRPILFVIVQKHYGHISARNLST